MSVEDVSTHGVGLGVHLANVPQRHDGIGRKIIVSWFDTAQRGSCRRGKITSDYGVHVLQCPLLQSSQKLLAVAR